MIQAVTFSSPSWRSPTTIEKGHLTIPKGSQRIARYHIYNLMIFTWFLVVALGFWVPGITSSTFIPAVFPRGKQISPHWPRSLGPRPDDLSSWKQNESLQNIRCTLRISWDPCMEGWMTLYRRVLGSPNHQLWDPIILRVKKIYSN